MTANRLRWSRPEAAGGLITLYLIGVWLMTHWYRGVDHDAMLYAGQALARLYPDLLRSDLFFAYGSQDDFTLFTPVFAAIAARISIGDAAFALTLLAHMAWVLLAFALARRIAPGPAQWLGLAFVLGTIGIYGPGRIFSYGEGFITARIWAEVFSLGAVLSSVQGKKTLALCLSALGLATHPIIGLAGAGFTAFHSLSRRQLLYVALLGAAMVALLMLSGASSAARLTAIMDPEWFDIVVRRAPYVFITRWSTADINEVFCLLAITTAAYLTSAAQVRRIWLALLLTLAAGLAVALLATVSHHALLVQMQAWRVLWLARVLVPLAFASMIFDCWPKGNLHRLTLVWLALGWLLPDYWGGAIAIGVVVTFAWLRGRPGVPISRSVILTSWLALGLAAIIAFGSQAQRTLHTLYQFQANADPLYLTRQQPSYALHLLAVMFGGAVSVLLLVPVMYGARKAAVWQFAVFVLATSLGLFAALNWDQRTLVNRDLYSGLAQAEDPLTRYFPENATIYVDNGFHYTWFALHRPNYASSQQGVSSLFSRQAAIEQKRRLTRLARLRVPDSVMDWNTPLAVDPKAATAKLPFDGLVHVCHDPKLDFVVLYDELAQGQPRPMHRRDGWKRYVYDCSVLRASFPDPFST